jgi:hypothetical protein
MNPTNIVRMPYAVEDAVRRLRERSERFLRDLHQRAST